MVNVTLAQFLRSLPYDPFSRVIKIRKRMNSAGAQHYLKENHRVFNQLLLK